MSHSLDKNTEEPNAETKIVEEKLLEKLAAEELLREACQGAIRAEAIGPSGWLRNKNPKTNKTFLKNTLKNAISSNNYNFSRKKDDLSNVRNKDNKRKAQEESKSIKFKPYYKRS